MSTHHGGPCIMTSAEQFYVRVCGCGIVHLSFGVATINVTAETAVAISETLKEVSNRLKLHLDDRVAPPLEAQVSAIKDTNENVIYGNFSTPASTTSS